MDQLRLAAFDAEDLAVVSAHVQDAVLKVGDIAFIPKEKRFAGVINRFVWEKQPEGTANKKNWERRRSGFHFDRVLAVRSTGIDRSRPDAVLDLLAIAFEASDEPAGTITLIFAGGGAIALDVECIEGAVRDLGPAWSTHCCPEHRLDDLSPETAREPAPQRPV